MKFEKTQFKYLTLYVINDMIQNHSFYIQTSYAKPTLFLS